MVRELTKNATLKELEEAGLVSYYADHNKGIVVHFNRFKELYEYYKSKGY